MEISDELPIQARELACQYFREDLNNCAETVFRAIMQASGRDCPVEILKMASPFGRGMGGSGCACGALVGGQMAIGVFFGRDKYTGTAPDICGKASQLLHERFKKQNGATCCRILHKGQPFGTKEQFDSCCERTLKAAELAASVITEVAVNGSAQDKVPQ